MKKLLFLCSQNRLRSPTAEAVFSEYEGLEVESAGLDRNAELTVSTEMIEWADIIFVMEKSHRIDTPRPKGTRILGSASPLSLNPLRYLDQRWFSPQALTFGLPDHSCITAKFV
jgi:protein-tyrosine-phosphatase